MSLRKKSFLAALVTMGAMLVILYSLSQSILLGSFLRLEAQSVADNVERVVNALEDETTALSLITTDWAYWDETYHFVQTQDEGYVVGNLNEETLTNLNLSFIVFVDAARNIVYSKVLESGTGEVVPDDTALQEPWIGSDEFFRMIDLEGNVNGYIQTAHGPALVAARSILTSVKEGPTAGTLIMGRYLNDYRIQTVSQSLRMMIELHSAAESEAHEGFVAVAAGPSEIYLKAIDDHSVNGYTLVDDVFAQPIFYIHVILPRDIYAQGQATLDYVLLAFLGIGVAFTVAALAYVDRLLLRLSRLSETMTRIRETDDVSVDVIVDGQDEIANLANGLREMLAALARSRNELWQTNDYLEKLVEQRTADLVQTNEILLQEVAERKQAQADLAQARDQALEVLRLKSHILANISHDARTPLSVILMGAQMLELGRYGPVNEKQREKLESISDHVNQLDGFISNLLDGVTMNNAKLRLEPADVAPVDLLSNLDTDLGPLARRKGLELTWAISDEVPEVIHTDAQRFNQILSNLVGNAIKFTKEGSVKVRLYCPDDRHWALEVSDTGPGIEVNAQDHIFDAFWQVDGSMTRETSRGVGLGLSIVKQLTGLMNGKTAVVSKIGVGTTFRLVFPLDKNDEMAVDAQAVRAGR